MRRLPGLICCLTVLLSATLGGAAEPFWPQWRGPDRSGVSSDTGLLTKWPEGGPKLLWKATGAGAGFSSVSMTDGRLYTMGAGEGNDFVVCFDLKDGRRLWSTTLGKIYRNKYGDGPRCTPTLDGDRLYAVSGNGDLACLKAADGGIAWKLNILAEFGGKNIKWGISESPLIDGDRVIICAGGKGGSIVALNKTDGKLIWRSRKVKDDPGYASALLVDLGGVKQVIHFTAAAVLGLRAEDGELLWRYTKVANDIANCATPLYHDGQVFATSNYDTGAALLRLTPTGGKVDAEQVYFTRDMMNHHGGVILVGGHLYGCSNKTLVCMEWKTGKELWKHRSVGKGSLTAAEGMLYCLSENGVVGLVKASPKGYEEISRFSIEVDGPNSWAYPVVAGGRLFIRNGDQVLCYDIRRQ